MTFQAPATLTAMLTYCRPSDSLSESEFIARFIVQLGAKPDSYGNYWLTVGPSPKVLWSTHIDTVHHKSGRQRLKFDQSGIVSLAKPKVGTCLGADDAAGLWLASEMIRYRVPGIYIFHRDEESGGQGSSFIARSHKPALDGIEFAIALDRKGYDSVITHQFSRCCSDAFAFQLADLLGGKFAPDDTGLFTDTANYTDIVSECTNISVGYFDQHGPKERLDVPFVMALADTLCSVDFSKLQAHRDPDAIDSFWQKDYDGGRYYGYGKGHGFDYGSTNSRFADLVRDHSSVVAH